MQNGQPRKPKTVEAERFILRDAAGNVRALLGMDSEGGTFLHLNDQGRNAIELCVKGDGSRFLAVRDRDGDIRACLVRVIGRGGPEHARKVIEKALQGS